MLPGRAVAARFVRPNETEIVRENERLERPANLFAAEYGSHLRSDQELVVGTCPVSGARACRSCYLEHVQGGAQRQSVRRLEPERRTQNYYLRLFPPR